MESNLTTPIFPAFNRNGHIYAVANIIDSATEKDSDYYIVNCSDKQFMVILVY